MLLKWGRDAAELRRKLDRFFFSLLPSDSSATNRYKPAALRQQLDEFKVVMRRSTVDVVPRISRLYRNFRYPYDHVTARYEVDRPPANNANLDPNVSTQFCFDLGTCLLARRDGVSVSAKVPLSEVWVASVLGSRGQRVAPTRYPTGVASLRDHR